MELQGRLVTKSSIERPVNGNGKKVRGDYAAGRGDRGRVRLWDKGAASSLDSRLMTGYFVAILGTQVITNLMTQPESCAAVKVKRNCRGTRARGRQQKPQERTSEKPAMGGGVRGGDVDSGGWHVESQDSQR